MKKSLAFAAAAALAATVALAQANPRGEASLSLGDKSVQVEYGRPSLKGRDMLGQATVGSDWRMGADAATSLKTEVDLAFGEIAIPKGSYTLTATKVADDAWRLNVQDAAGKRVAEVPLKASSVETPVETFTIGLEKSEGGGVFRMSWGSMAQSAAFTAK